MKLIAKKLITTFLVTGIIFAGLMASWDYIDGTEFRLLKYILNAAFFGLFMTLMSWNSWKKKKSTKEQ